MQQLRTLFTILFLVTGMVGWGQIISQYVETNSGTTPKGVEIWNNTGTDIIFSPSNNLQIFQGTNGGSCSALSGTNITSGTLADGEVWVIGTSDVVSYVSTNGTNLSGTTTFSFGFNGDDALEVRLGGVLIDMFGICGSDPGSAWTGSGVSTANQNIELNTGITTGNPGGFTDPSTRFTTVSSTPATLPAGLAGFGDAPTLPSTAPTGVSTGTAGSITATSAIISGNSVSTDGGSAITERGVAYSTSPTPTIADNTATTPGTTGSFDATLSGLSSSTTYYARAYATNSVGTTYGSDVSFTTNAPVGDTDSDIIENASFTYPTNIDYTTAVNSGPLTTGNSIEVAQFTIRDGGAGTDADALSTTLTNLDLSISEHAQLNRVAIFDGSTNVAEVAAGSSVSFGSLSLTAADDGTQDFSVRVSFQSTVTDNAQLQFTITSATAQAGASLFAAGDAGGAATSTSGDNNRIEVSASTLAFVQQPSNTDVNVAMSPAVTVEALDGNSNRDLDYTTNVEITSTGTLTGSPVSVAAVAGLATFSTLTHTVTGTGLELTASDGVITNATSGTFDINIPVSTINFDDDLNWTAGSASITSYASDHVYSEANWSFTGGGALRNTTTAQDGFAGAFGTYSWRLRDNSSVVWTATYTSNLASNERFISFGFDARRWDDSPSPDFLVEYSFNGGSTWNTATDIGSSGVINNTSLGSTSDWSTFSQSITGPAGVAANQMVVRVSAQGTTERLMIDNFTYSTSTSTINFTFSGSWSPTDPSGIAGTSESISITSGTASITADTDCDDLSVSLGATLNLNPTVELETAGNLTNNGSIVLNADATGYAQLKVNGTISGSGTATVEQYIPSSGWRNIGLPLASGTALSALGTIGTDVTTGVQNLYYWDAANTQWVNVVNGSEAHVEGRGYIAYFGGSYGVGAAPSIISVTGSLTQSVAPVVNYSGATGNEGWNLVSNPFSCGLDFGALSGRQNMNNSFSRYNAGTGSYSSYSGASADLVDRIIPPMGSFWVRATAGSPSLGPLNMATHGTVGAAPTFFKNQTTIADRFFLNVFEAADPLKQDEFLLAMIPGTQDANDQEWDAFKRLNDAQVPSLMSVANGDELAINAIDYSPNNIRTKKLQLRFVSGKNNEIYFIELHDSLLTNNYHIELEDLKLRRKHNLKSAPYKFVHDQNAEYRFVLYISPVTTINQGHTHTPVVNGGVNVGINGGTLVLKMNAPHRDVQGALLDLNGRRVMDVEYPAGVEQYEINVNGLAKGVYLLQLQAVEGDEVHKVILP